jgi:hypothetical protein
MTLRGAREFRHRLEAIRHTAESVAQDWADEDVRRVRSEIQRRTGETAASVHVESVTLEGARVVGSPVVNFLASGTKAHIEVPTNAQAMRFVIGGRTIFSKRVNHPATKGNPSIRQAAGDALRGFSDALYRLWNKAA